MVAHYNGGVAPVLSAREAERIYAQQWRGVPQRGFVAVSGRDYQGDDAPFEDLSISRVRGQSDLYGPKDVVKARIQV